MPEYEDKSYSLFCTIFYFKRDSDPQINCTEACSRHTCKVIPNERNSKLFRGKNYVERYFSLKPQKTLLSGRHGAKTSFSK